MTPLNLLKAGQKAMVREVHGGAHLVHRLSALGVIPGRELTVVRSGRGPLVVKIRDDRVILGRGISHRLLVEVIGQDAS